MRRCGGDGAAVRRRRCGGGGAAVWRCGGVAVQHCGGVAVRQCVVAVQGGSEVSCGAAVRCGVVWCSF